MVDRVVCAIYSEYNIEVLGDDVRQRMRSKAIAAIKAMRECSPKMVASTWYHEIDKNGGIESQNTRNKRIYTAMIDAALGEHK